ncbi:MAG: UDP-N-acetylmuramate dehydrogenase [Candidatus Cryptobacteroides sp.]
MYTTEYYKDLSKLNTFRMKVTARAFVEYDSVADLVDLDLEGLPRPLLHIGAGSNLLFTGDFKGTVLHSRISFIEPLGDGLVSVGSGVVFDGLCSWACDNGLWGLENLSGIPGEVGASAVQNIGAYGVEVKDVIRTVYCYDLQEEEFVHFDNAECLYGYRDSVFKRPDFKGRYIVTHVVFNLSAEPAPRLDYGHIRQAVEEALPQGTELTPSLVRKVVTGIRNSKLPDPKVLGSAGSFFKNPVVGRDVYERIASANENVPHYDLEDGQVKIPAAWLIEQCGWKGRRMGGAAVYDKQPLVIVNYTGEAYPEEIIGLERRIVESVRTKFDIELKPEVDHI